MRLTVGIIGLGLCATGLAACSDYTDFNQCANDCSCQRVACCCGTGCDKQGSTEQYNACVPANSPYEQWTGCPAANSCSAYSGLVRIITPCVVPTPAPSSANNDTNALDIPFGTTFPMIGTKALSHETWQSNVYMGTTMQFNPGAFWGYTDSYSVPARNSGYNNNGGSYNGGGYGYDNGGYGNPTPAPTPIDATGRPCYSYSQPCPTGYYCKLDSGYNVQQKGVCQHEAQDAWTGGAGKFTDSQYYTSLTHPPLVLDPDHNGVSDNYGGGYYSGSGYGYGYTPSLIPGVPGAQTCGPLPSGAPVCGFKSFTGSCFCDSDCSTKGDCCPDYAQYCGVLSNQYTGYSGPPASSAYSSIAAYSSTPVNPPAYSPPATSSSASGNCDAVGQCAGLCGSSAPAVGVNGKPCYCDSQCAATGDCCCSQAQCLR